MPDKRIRTLDPLGIIAIANVLVHQDVLECTCELKPGPGCTCQNECSCELKPGPGCTCQNECSCELKPVQADILEMLSNPVFRDVVKELDIKKLRTIENFLSIVDEFRTKIDSSRLPSSNTSKKS